MKRLLAALLVVSSLSAAAPAAAARDRCAHRGSTTLARNDFVRVYERAGFVFGCRRASGKRHALSSRYAQGELVPGPWGKVVLNGSFVAWNVLSVDVTCRNSCPSDYDVSREWVRTFDVRTGSWQVAVYEGDLSALAVSGTGGVAFVVDGRLSVADGGGQRVVETADIDPRTVRIEGSALTYRTEAGETRSRAVDGGTTCRARASTTLAWNDVGRAYDRDGVLYACRWLRNRQRRLTRAPHGHVELAGRFVAWSEPGTVVVRDLLRGREVRPSAGAVLDVALGGDGTVAWLEDGGRLLATRGIVARELAAGAIEPGSLAVRLGTVHWRQDGEPRSARVPG